MRRSGDQTLPAPIPPALRAALQAYTDTLLTPRGRLPEGEAT
jgi:hypothetical protein